MLPKAHCTSYSHSTMLADDDHEDPEQGQTSSKSSDDEMDGDSDTSSSEDKSTQVKKAAAAMAVGVGSFADPADMQGLSHYLEHMLFMGSAEFPGESEYTDYLAQHAGTSNAYTEAGTPSHHPQKTLPAAAAVAIQPSRSVELRE